MAMVLTVPRYTVADLERFPDDGQRYELLRAGHPRDQRVTGGLRWQPPRLDPPIELDLDRGFADLA